MRRRQFIGLIGGAAAWPLAARGQQKARYPTIVLVGAGLTIGEETRRAFEAACSEFGWVEGRNIHIVYRWAEPSQMRAVVAEIASSAPELIVALGTSVAAMWNKFSAPLARPASSFGKYSARIAKLSTVQLAPG